MFNYLLASYLFAFIVLGVVLIISWLNYNKIRFINAKKGKK